MTKVNNVQNNVIMELRRLDINILMGRCDFQGNRVRKWNKGT
jgi:hypothetical protein